MSDIQNDSDDENTEQTEYEYADPSHYPSRDPADGPPQQPSDASQQADPILTPAEVREHRRERFEQKSEQARRNAANPFAPDDEEEAAEIHETMTDAIESHPALADYTASELEDMYPWYEASEEQQAREFAEHALGQAGESRTDRDGERDSGENATDELDHGRSHDSPPPLASTPSMGDDADGDRDTRSAVPNTASNTTSNTTDSMSDNDRPVTSADQPRERTPESRERRERRADGSADRDEATPMSDDNPRESRQEPAGNRREQQNERRGEPADDIPPPNRDSESPARDADVPGENLSPNEALARTINDRNRTKEDTLETIYEPIPVEYRKGDQADAWDFAQTYDAWVERQVPADDGNANQATDDDTDGEDEIETEIEAELREAVEPYRSANGVVDFDAMPADVRERVRELSAEQADDTTTRPDGEFIRACVNFLCAGRRDRDGRPVPVVIGGTTANGEEVDTDLVTGALRSGQVPVGSVLDSAVVALFFSLENDLDRSFL
jgi:hypothetical protein